MKLEDLVKALAEAGLDEEGIKAELEKLASEIGEYVKGCPNGECGEQKEEPMDEEKEQKRLFGI